MPKYQRYYGKYLLFINKGDEALEVFKKLSLNSSEVNYLTYYHLGYSYYLLSDYDNAKYSFNKALALRDDDETTGFFLNQLLINFFPVNDTDKIKRSKYYYDKAMRAKKKSQSLIPIYFL
jgi:tetratricopeptide (TPR) repeat protein